MSTAHVRSQLLGLALALAWASEAAAQQMVSSLDQLTALRETKASVTVTDASGRQFRGTLADATATVLSLRTGGGTRQFAAADVRSVRVRPKDSRLNGSLIGAAVGAGFTSLIFLDNECHDDPFCFGVVGAYAAIGALVGFGLDSVIRRSVVVYAAPGSGPPASVTVAPLLSRGRTGVRLTIAF